MPKFFATCPKGLESLLFDELRNLNADQVKETVAGVAFSGDMTVAMRACLYSRFASRILLTLNTFKCEDDVDLYLGAHGIGYENYFTSDKTIAVSFNGSNKAIRNTQYGALRVKDAICDRFVASKHPRPNVDKHNPDVRIFANLKKGEATISLDLSGSAQFYREFQRSTGAAPLKENLAAAMVVRSGFDDSCNLVDPMCGSATILLEAALIATDTAPGLKRHNFGFTKLKDFDQDSWKQLLDEANERSKQGKIKALEKGIHLYGFDADSRVVERARQNIESASFSDLITVSQQNLDLLTNPCKDSALKTIVVTNPPYGERMGNFNELILLYTTLGKKLKQHFASSTAAVISSSSELLSCLRLTSSKSYRLYNGALDCQLRLFSLNAHDSNSTELDIANAANTTNIDGYSANADNANALNNRASKEQESNEEIQSFINRLTKNLRKLEKWARKENIEAYRVYDADIPMFNAAIDRYGDKYILQEYQAPSNIQAYVAKQRLLDMIAATITVTNVPGENVIVKSREKQKGDAQYIKREDAQNNFMTITEGDIVFKVNLFDYLDTGLFLDARPIRRLLASLAENKDFLNLFAYTSTASVVAAYAGAKSTTSVDMSRTYLDWGMDNFNLNRLDTRKHNFVQADCLAYLSTEQGKRYDLIYIDPPTFSNSKRMEKSFDVQRDHLQLLGNLTRHLNDGGIVIFCTNRRGFKIAQGLEEYGFSVEDITAKTYDIDFARDQKLHSCYKLVYSKSKQSKEPESLVINTQRPKWSRDLDNKSERFSYHGDKYKSRRFNDDAQYISREKRDITSLPSHRATEASFNKDKSFNKERSFKGDKSFTKSKSFGEKREFRGSDQEHSFKERVNKPRLKTDSSVRKVRVWGPTGVKDID